MIKLKVVIASTRAARKGPAVGAWLMELLKYHNEFITELLDLAEINLPFLDEPNHPRLKQYTKEHTKKWSAIIDSSDAFIFVMPEYNFGFNAPLKNAIDFLHNEWLYKPVGFVTYGGIAAGTRALQMIKLVVTALKMTPITEAVNIPFFTQYIDDAGKFNASESTNKAAESMLTELAKCAENLKGMRKQN